MKKISVLVLLLAALSLMFAVESEPSEVVGFVKYNLPANDYSMVSVPMEITFPVAGATPMASDLAAEIGDTVEQIIVWASGSWSFYTGTPESDFEIQPGDAFLVKVGEGDALDFYSAGSRVADVATSFAADYNMMMHPLNHPEITTAAQLATAIGSEISQVIVWNNGSWQFYTGTPESDFDIEIGDALLVLSTGETVWNDSSRSRSHSSSSSRTRNVLNRSRNK